MPKNENIAAIILPTYNEAANIQSLISAILAQEKNTQFNFKIVVSDSASPDGTGKIVTKLAAKNPRIHLIDVKERGLGLAIVKGVEFAISKFKPDYLVIMDADFSHNPADLPKLLTTAGKGFDLVIGSRLVKGGKNLLPFYRQILSLGESLVMRFLTGFFEVAEWGTAFRVIKVSLWKKIAINRIPWRKRSFVFQPAFLYFALVAGAKWVEVPIIFEDRKAGYSKIAIVSYTFDTLRFAAEIFLRRRATFVKFLIVGTIGFIVNTAALFLLYDTQIIPLTKGTSWRIFVITHPDAKLFIASVIAVETAIISNFLWHENWTFRWRPKRSSAPLRFARFNLVAIVSPIIQVATVNVLTPFFGIYYLVSNAIGVLLGLSWNWLWNSKVIWRG